MENEMRKFHILEGAFQKIKTSTGNADVQEMVYKFLTKEQTYGTLLTQVNQNENLLESLRAENDKKSDILHALEIDNQDQEADVAKTNDENKELIEL